MRRRILLVLLALLTVPLGAQTPAPLQVPYQQFKLANGLNVILHRDTSIPVVAVNMWYYVGSANEKPGRTGFAHLFEHLMFEGSKHVPEGQFDILLEGAGGDNNGSTSNDRTNYVIDVPVERARAGAVSRVGPHGLPARHDDAAASGRPARRRQERTATELREPAVRHGIDRDRQDAVAGDSPIQLAHDRLHGRPHRREPLGRRRVLQEVLRAQQCQPRGGRRHRLRSDARARREVVRRDPARNSGGTGRAAGRRFSPACRRRR